MEGTCVKLIVCAVVLCIGFCVTAIGSRCDERYFPHNGKCKPCSSGCLTCQPLDDITSFSNCTNCTDGFFIGKSDDIDIRSRLSKTYEKEIFGSTDNTPTRSVMMCYKCSAMLQDCDRCNWNDFSALTCTSCMDSYVVVSQSGSHKTAMCQHCSKFTDNCKRCKWIDKLGEVTCTSCVEGYVIGYSGWSYQYRICEECTKLINNCDRCEWTNFGIRCTRCLDGYTGAGQSCNPKSTLITVTIILVVCLVPIAMLAYAVGVLRLCKIMQKRNAAQRPTEGDQTWMNKIKNAVFMIIVVITAVVPLVLSIYELVPKQLRYWLRQKWDRFRTDATHIGGSISYYPDKTALGSGSEGTVFEGRYGLYKKKTVAVKVINCLNYQDAKDTRRYYKEINTMETIGTTAQSTHIIHFLDSYIKQNKVFLVFELAKGTLVEYMLPSNASWQEKLTSDDVIRGIVAGLYYTHSKNIVHRDLKPGNIFIVENSDSTLKAVIGDFGQAKETIGGVCSNTGTVGTEAYRAPEIWNAMSHTTTVSIGSKCTKASDIFSLGLVMYYAKSLGHHPFGHNLTAQHSISIGNIPAFQHIANLINSFAFEEMLKGMLQNNPDDRPSIEVVSGHPALWTSDTIIKYFGLKSDKFESMIKAGTSTQTLLEDPLLIPNGDWMNQLPVNMRTYLRKYKLPNRKTPLYKGKEKEVKFLLRAIRNTNAHHQDYPPNTQADMGTYPEGHVALWLTVCPGLLMHVYDKLGP